MFRALLRLCLLASSLTLALPLFAAEPPAFGVIVGYKDGVNPLSREETDRGPWADRRARSAAAWARAAHRSRELTARVAREAGVRGEADGEAGRAALLRFDRPRQGRDLDDALRRLRLHPDVAWVEPNVLVPRQQTIPPNDTLYTNQWHLRGPALGEAAGLNMESAWGLTTGSAGTVVAVVDSGITAHSELPAGRLLPGYDFVSELSVANDGNGRDNDPSDPGDWVSPTDRANEPLFAACDLSYSSWHGTFIAGQIAAATDNGAGVAGLNWQTRILPVRVSGKCGALVSDLLDGARWAAGLPVAGAPVNLNPARVINLSFGGSTACSPAYQSMVDDVTAAGALLVVAAGNRAAPLTRPADCDGVMAVASVRRDGAKADYSSFGPNVALAAPGGSDEVASYRLLSLTNNGLTAPTTEGFGYSEGTSFSAPQAAGVASLMLALNPNLTPRALMERMQAGVRPHAAPGGLPFCGGANSQVCKCTTTTCGAGLLDAFNALQLATGPAAVIQAVGTVAPGATITLDGRNSIALAGASIVSHQWSLDSGPAVTIPNDTLAQTGLRLPAVAGRWVFRLTVTDSNGASGTDAIIVRAVEPAPAPSGGGGGPVGAWTALVLLACGLGLRRARHPSAARA